MTTTAIIQVDDWKLDTCARSASHPSENADRTSDNPTYSPSAWAITTPRFIGSRKGDDYRHRDRIVVGSQSIPRGKPAGKSEKNSAERRPEIVPDRRRTTRCAARLPTIEMKTASR